MPRLGPRRGRNPSDSQGFRPGERWPRPGSERSAPFPALGLAWRAGGWTPRRDFRLRGGASRAPGPPQSTRAPFRAGWRPLELTLAMETGSGSRRHRGKLLAPAATALLPPRSDRRQPPGGSALYGFTCKNAVPRMPSHRLFLQVTRGTLDPRHPPGNFLVALISKPVQSDYCTF